MAELLPSRFLLRMSLPIHRQDKMPGKGRELLSLPASCTLPDPQELDQQKGFGQLKLAWNKGGVGISLSVPGKKQPPRCKPDQPWESDSLHLWLDTRNTQSIHRASKFCHHFCVLPTGEGKDSAASARQLSIPRAREETPLCKPQDLRVASEIKAQGYHVDLWIPAKALNGYDPESNPRIGFYYYLRDSELGEQFLSVGHEFPFSQDPSLWWTLELVD